MDIKNLGQVYTKKDIALKVLELTKIIDYSNLKILENSCGDGIFIECLLELGANPNNIYCIDIDPVAIQKVKNKFPQIPEKNIYLGSAFDKRAEYKNKFDLVVGNPPYVRIHNLDKDFRDEIQNSCSFCSSGMTDLYLAFFNLALECLNNNGILSYITPSSYLTSRAGKELRDYIDNNKLLFNFLDYKDKMVFDGIGTYTCITTLKINNSQPILSPWGSNHTKIGIKCNNLQNGIATLKDSVYIKDTFGYKIDYEGLVRPIIKASTLEEKKCIYPYRNGQLINEQELIDKYPNTYNYLLANKSLLLIRSITPSTPWYAYGRSQGLINMENEKIVIANINLNNTLRFKRVNKEYIVYSGLYATGNLDEFELQLTNQDFIDYLTENGTPKRGGYYSFGSTTMNSF